MSLAADDLHVFRVEDERDAIAGHRQAKLPFVVERQPIAIADLNGRNGGENECHALVDSRASCPSTIPPALQVQTLQRSPGRGWSRGSAPEPGSRPLSSHRWHFASAMRLPRGPVLFAPVLATRARQAKLLPPVSLHEDVVGDGRARAVLLPRERRNVALRLRHWSLSAFPVHRSTRSARVSSHAAFSPSAAPKKTSTMALSTAMMSRSSVQPMQAMIFIFR